MKNPLLFFVLILLLLNSCSKKSSFSPALGVIELDEAASNTDLILQEADINIIRLEETEESLLSGIQKAYIEMTSDRIFVLSDFNLHFFDGEGKFLTKLPKGRGPGEVLQAISFDINRTRQTVFVLDDCRFILEYDFDGNFIRKSQLDEFYSMHLYSEQDMLFLISNYVGKSEKSYVGQYNFKEEKITQRYVPNDFSPYPLSTNFIPTYSFFEKSNELYFFTPDIFGLFKYDGDDFKLLYSYEIGDKKVPDALIKKLFAEERSSFRAKAKLKNYAPNLLYVAHHKDYFLIGLDDNQRSCYVFDTNYPDKVYCHPNISYFFNLPDINSFKYPMGSQDNTLVFACNPTDLFGKDEFESTKTVTIGGHPIDITIEDNPFLVQIQ